VISYTPPSGLTWSKFPDGGEWPWVNGKPIRSVSKILNVIYPLPPDLPKWALERGKMIHASACLIDKGTLDWDTLDERLKPFCSAYVAFIDTAHPIIEASELTVVHPSLKFGARLDRVYRLPWQSRLVVTDIKGGTGKEDRYWLQVAACAMALDEGNIKDYDLALLNLDRDGNPHFTCANDPGLWVNRWREILETDVA
jgi:hypothetical protein